MSASEANLVLIATVARRLGSLRERVAFLGGATTALLVTDPAAAAIRATRDVDLIVTVASYIQYQHVLGAELRAAGFEVDTSEGAPLCRWLVEGVKVDLMPTDTSVLGFTNRWYAEAMEHAEAHRLPDGISIRLVTAPYFLATKIEAFQGRGGGPPRAAHDLAMSRPLADLALAIAGLAVLFRCSREARLRADPATSVTSPTSPTSPTTPPVPARRACMFKGNMWTRADVEATFRAPLVQAALARREIYKSGFPTPGRLVAGTGTITWVTSFRELPPPEPAEVHHALDVLHGVLGNRMSLCR